MYRVIFLRHGQSASNAIRQVSGQLDVELSEQGREEAAAAGRRLAEFPIGKIYSSPLKRALDTALIALVASGAKDWALRVHQSLKERDYAELTGLSHEEIIARYGEKALQALRLTLDAKLAGCESLREVRERALDYWRQSIAPGLSADKVTLIVGHAGTFRALLSYFESIPDNDLSSLQLGNASLYLCQFDDTGERITKREKL